MVRRPISSNIVATPSPAQASIKVKEPQSLKNKEKEIEAMRRKIVELERRKSKQTASRPQTPEKFGIIKGSPQQSEKSMQPPDCSSGNTALGDQFEERRIRIGNLVHTITKDNIRDFLKGYAM